MLFRNFLGKNFFFGRTPPGRNRRFTGILATRALREILGPKMAQKCQKQAVVVGGGAETEKNATTLSGMLFRNFLGNNFFFGRTPPRPESAIYWFFGHPGT